jgi:hypothetical protein
VAVAATADSLFDALHARVAEVASLGVPKPSAAIGPGPAAVKATSVFPIIAARALLDAAQTLPSAVTVLVPEPVMDEAEGFEQAAGARHVSFARASAANLVKADGGLQAFAANAPRLDARGVVVEPERTNLQRNAGQAGVAASGALPIGYTAGGCVLTVLNVEDRSDGRRWVRYRMQATNTGASFQYPRLNFPLSGVGSVAAGETITTALWVQLESTTHVLRVLPQFYLASGGYLSGLESILMVAGPVVHLSASGIIPAASLTASQFAPVIGPDLPAGQTFDATFWVSSPQVEKASSASSFVLTPANASSTRAADVLTLTPLPGVYDIETTYSDGSITSLPAQAINAAGWVVPVNAAKPIIARIRGVSGGVVRFDHDFAGDTYRGAAMALGGAVLPAANEAAKLLSVAYRAMILGEAMAPALEVPHDSRQAALQWRSTLATALNLLADEAAAAASIATAQGSDVYLQALTLRSAVLADIDERIGRLPSVQVIEPGRQMNAWALAQHAYGDDPASVVAGMEDIVARNGLAHPAMAGPDRIEILPPASSRGEA